MFNFEHLLKCYSSAGQVLCNTYPQNVLLFRCVVRLNANTAMVSKGFSWTITIAVPCTMVDK